VTEGRTPSHEPIVYLHDRTCAKVMHLGWCTCGAGMNRCSTDGCDQRKGHPRDCDTSVTAPARTTSGKGSS
jgi:hypothetical protein